MKHKKRGKQNITRSTMPCVSLLCTDYASSVHHCTVKHNRNDSSCQGLQRSTIIIKLQFCDRWVQITVIVKLDIHNWLQRPCWRTRLTTSQPRTTTRLSSCWVWSLSCCHFVSNITRTTSRTASSARTCYDGYLSSWNPTTPSLSYVSTITVQQISPIINSLLH